MGRKKSNLGQFNTRNNVWLRPHIEEFIKDVGASVVVDPFAGRGDLLHAVKGIGEWEVAGYDIDPDLCTDMGWTWNDSLDEVPYHSDAIVVTNPPYLAKNSAARNGLDNYEYFKDPDNAACEDLYQIALRKVLERYKKAVFIIPETYFQTAMFKTHLHSYTIIEENPFTDTDCPVCVSCFDVQNDFLSIAGNNYAIYKNDAYVFCKHELEDRLWKFNSPRYANLTFNAPNGQLGLRAVDGVNPYDKIRFDKPKRLNYSLDKIGESSRSITLIDVHGYKINERFLRHVNFWLRKLRRDTHDVVLSPFKNNNKLGIRRRRLDYHWARKIIEKAMETLDK